MAYPIFILEGPDNGGKSTLAKALARKCGAEIVHSTYRFKGRMAAYHLAQFRKALRIAQNKPVVLDRWWPSEVAYGNTFRDGCEYAQNLPFYQQLGHDYWCSYTYCMPARWEEYWSWCLKVWNQSEEMYEPDEAKYHWLWMNYRDMMFDHRNINNRSNVLQYFNVTLEAWRDGDSSKFAGYIIARMMNNLRYLAKPEEKDLMNRMAYHWKLVGRVPNNELPEIPNDDENNNSLAETRPDDPQGGSSKHEYVGATQQELPL